MKVYEKVYEYFLSLMVDGRLKAGDRMPSLRESTKDLNVSRTSVETAYNMLAEDGYIYSVEKTGYFVTKLAGQVNSVEKTKAMGSSEKDQSFDYDFATIGEDPKASCLDLWRRYMKSALRQEDRLLSYAKNQGESDLREEIAAYVRKTRNIICTREDIVIGAGFQNLLAVLIPMLQGEKTVSFPTRDFTDGATTFANAGYEVSYRNKKSHVMYVVPAYMTKWGDVMTMTRRREIIEHAKNDNHIIIEDDYQNEFVFSSKPTPSLYAMSGGDNVVYLSSFSRVLLPSVRISFLILPRELRSKYRETRNLYNQTASKAEQIALAQFLRDGHLMRHIRKMRRLYEDKREIMLEALEISFKDKGTIRAGESGMEIALELNRIISREEIQVKGIDAVIIGQGERGSILLLSCSQMPADKIGAGIEHLRRAL